MYDLVITNGLVVDGTGATKRHADVAILDGRIAGIGHYAPSDGHRSIDADGRVVAPGFIDPHTHYDPQLMFDPYAQSSCYHGVTTVVTGNCGFGIAPTHASHREGVSAIFARVEEMSLDKLNAIDWDFESFPEMLDSRKNKLGVNAAYYLAHSNVRLYAMGEAAYERDCTSQELARMREIVREAMAAGAAGLSSSHSPGDLDLYDRPVPSRLSSHAELETLVAEVGQSNRGTFAYLPYSAIGGLTEEDGELLRRIAKSSRIPVIIQGLGARSKVDAPTATWPESEKFLDRCASDGAAIYSMLMARPFNRPFDLATGTTMYEGAIPFDRLFSEAETVEERRAMLLDPEYRKSILRAVEEPNQDPEAGPVLPPPPFKQVTVDRVTRDENRGLIGRSIAEIAEERSSTPMDTFVEIALSEDLETTFLWRTDDEAWQEGTYLASIHPQMIVGTSDGGAHLSRDDGAEFSSYFLRYWVREWQKWTLEAAIHELTFKPATLLGLNGRGALIPGFAADIAIFDPLTVGPDLKEFRADPDGGMGRWISRPAGIHATIVNGVPIVVDGKLDDGCGLPGEVLRPGNRLHP